MQNVAVVYETKYGSTRQYAEWIADDLHCEVFERRSIRANDLQEFETIIYGGAVYAGGVLGSNFIRKNLDVLGEKNLVVFTCALSDPANEKNTRNIRDHLRKSLTEPVMDHVKIFHLRGAINYKKLGMVHRIMMAMMHRSVVKKDPESMTQEDREMLVTYGKSANFMDKDSVQPIVDYVRGLGELVH